MLTFNELEIPAQQNSSPCELRVRRTFTAEQFRGTNSKSINNTMKSIVVCVDLHFYMIHHPKLSDFKEIEVYGPAIQTELSWGALVSTEPQLSHTSMIMSQLADPDIFEALAQTSRPNVIHSAQIQKRCYLPV